MTDEYAFDPAIYVWARERAGYTIEEATRKLPIIEAYGKSPVERLKDIEAGVTNPTKTVIKEMARYYHCPEIVLSYGKIPCESNYGVDYRVLPRTVSKIEKGILNSAVGKIRARQMYIKAVLEDIDETNHIHFVNSMSVNENYKKIASTISRTINFDPEVFRKKKNSKIGFSYLRGLIESCGVFVLLYDNLGTAHTSLSSNVFQGFSLADDCVPFIVINSNDSVMSWTFTLFHELAHIWIGKTRICNRNFDDDIEALCDKVAQEILMSQTDLDKLIIQTDGGFDTMLSSISEIASNYHVDELVLTRQLFEEKRVNVDQYKRLKKVFNNTSSKKTTRDQRSTGANFHSVKKYRLGNLYFELVKRMVDNGEIMPTKASFLTGVPATQIYRFFGLV